MEKRPAMVSEFRRHNETFLQRDAYSAGLFGESIFYDAYGGNDERDLGIDYFARHK